MLLALHEPSVLQPKAGAGSPLKDISIFVITAMLCWLGSKIAHAASLCKQDAASYFLLVMESSFHPIENTHGGYTLNLPVSNISPSVGWNSLCGVTRSLLGQRSIFQISHLLFFKMAPECGERGDFRVLGKNGLSRHIFRSCCVLPQPYCPRGCPLHHCWPLNLKSIAGEFTVGL